MSEEKESLYLGPGFTRLKDGRVMCCICFKYQERKDLVVETIDGIPSTWDVCKGDCAIQAGIKEDKGEK